MTDRPIIFSARKSAEFRSLVMPEPNTGCHLWLGALNQKGYGRFSHGRLGVRPAHQVALDLIGRHRPAGLEVDHLCRVRCCVNPDHLEYVTHRVNLLRGETIAARSASRTCCPRGHPYEGHNLIVREGKRECRECQRAAQEGVYTPTTNRRRRRHLTSDEVALVRDLISRGVSHSKIGAQINLSIAAVSNIRTGKSHGR